MRALDERNMVWAHVDAAGHRRATKVERTDDGTIVFEEQWIPPSPEQRAALGARSEAWRALPPRGSRTVA
jgi:hypothetical protein